MQSFVRILAVAAAALPFLGQAAPVDTAAAQARSIPGKWIVQLKPETDIATIASHKVNVREIHARNLARREIHDLSAGIEREFGFGKFKGYAGSFDDATIEELKNLPEVMTVEEDFEMFAWGQVVTQTNSTWGLASISSRTGNSTGYTYDSSAGQGTFGYVVDTGVRLTHSEFGNRAVWGYNSVNDINTDNFGHGTHVAGTMAGTTFGVAKNSTIVAVKVFEGGSGSASQVIDGFNWAVNDIVSKNRTNTAVINMSLGGRASATWDAAVTAAWNQGVLSVVAAGNQNSDASNSSPGRSPEALTVGGVQKNDFLNSGPQGSNYGPVVDIFAPGTDVLSAWYTSDTAAEEATGTSMASPHVAGLVGYLRGLEGPSTAEAVKARILELATPGRVKDPKGSANLLAYNGIESLRRRI
ncbi:subtilisin-like protease-like protein [Periconia macrospinosa]|uniref:Subtilisin-like protease-like protein n=1 Tax=Periconia macrospinosa TaxID=97972 RepID=A0A2V1DSR7_9PLEO|nr:subtilisin-like protease-like protein [Periconia macrospinosa]